MKRSGLRFYSFPVTLRSWLRPAAELIVSQPRRKVSAVKFVTALPVSLNKTKRPKTYNSEDSLVVTHPTTNSPACGLSTAERTGSPVFHTLWSYVLVIIIMRHIFLFEK
ncbi:hypothetical protein N7475_001674 [Penicillium sp. IBT 31633x]|nr:hypothetical protein N7475_001674 [Penicillium sp. IBT 31633x]